MIEKFQSALNTVITMYKAREKYKGRKIITVKKETKVSELMIFIVNQP